MEPLIQLAVALAAGLAARFPTVAIGAVAHTVSTLWQPDPDAAMEDATFNEPELWVVDMAEILGGEQGVGTEEFSLLVILQQKIVSATARDQILALGNLASQVGRYCRSLEPTDCLTLNTADVSAICTRVERKPARNLVELRKKLYYTELLTTWRTA